MSTTWAPWPGSGPWAAAESQKLCKLLADFDIYGFPRGWQNFLPLPPSLFHLIFRSDQNGKPANRQPPR